MTFHVTQSDKDRALAYYGSIAKDYDKHVSRNRLLAYFRRREHDAIRQLLALDTGQPRTLIDVGCGNGIWALYGKSKGLEVTATDANQQMLDRLGSRVDHVVRLDLDNWTHDKTYDRVVCAGVLDFVLHPERAFAALAGATAPGGRLVVLVSRPGLGGLYYRFEKALIRVRVNLVGYEWLAHQAKLHGLVLAGRVKPLPVNHVIAFDRC